MKSYPVLVSCLFVFVYRFVCRLVYRLLLRSELCLLPCSLLPSSRRPVVPGVSFSSLLFRRAAWRFDAANRRKKENVLSRGRTLAGMQQVAPSRPFLYNHGDQATSPAGYYSYINGAHLALPSTFECRHRQLRYRATSHPTWPDRLTRHSMSSFFFMKHLHPVLTARSLAKLCQPSAATVHATACKPVSIQHPRPTVTTLHSLIPVHTQRKQTMS